MKKFTFMFKDEYSHGKWCTQIGICENLNQLISFYGLNHPNVEWKLVSEENVDQRGESIMNINESREDKLKNELEMLFDKNLGIKGIEQLETRFLKDFGCINFKTNDELHELNLARVFHKWHKEMFPERHAQCECELYRGYHETNCKCGFSEAYDSSD